MKLNWNSVGYLDLRSLAVFRIILGLFYLYSFVSVLNHFDSVFAPEGGALGECYMTSYNQEYPDSPWLFRLDSNAQMMTYIIGCLCVFLLFTIGIYPRIMALLGSILTSLFFNRYPNFYYGWEQIALCLLFLSAFLPIGDRLSLMKSKQSSDQNRIKNAFTWLVLCQIALIYFYNGVSKNGNLWMNGSAAGYAASSMDKGLAAGEWLSQNTSLTKFITYSTLVWELMFPLLIFAPLKNRMFRRVAALSVLLFHWSTSVFVDVGDFRLVAIPMAALLLPPEDWELLYRRAKIMPSRIQPIFKSIRFPDKSWINRTVAISLLVIIVISNLTHSLHSRTPDRFKHWLEGNALGSLLEQIPPQTLPQFSFFSQYWHLYSPNPPTELGFAHVELILENGDTLRVWNSNTLGKNDYPSRKVKLLFAYLLPGIRNKRDFSLHYCILNREMHQWARLHPETRLTNVQFVVYSWQPKNSNELLNRPQIPKREVRIDLAIK